MKVVIAYTNGRSTKTTMSESDYKRLRLWWLNPKSSKTYSIEGNCELLIHKDQIAFMLTEVTP